MRTLVLNVDRDDDFGRKAKVRSPIIGIKDNIDAAHKLGETDPEDSDLNAIFYAISIYKSLVQEGKDAELATICGDIKVGFKSDEILSQQLEEVLRIYLKYLLEQEVKSAAWLDTLRSASLPTQP